MKKILTTLCLGALATVAFGQGLLTGNNSPTTLFRTNSIAVGGSANTAVSAQVGPYYYEVLVNQSTVTTVDSSLQGLTAAGWSDTQYHGTNVFTAGRVASGQTAAPVNWPPNTFLSFMLVAWTSAEGNDWTTLSAKLTGATFSGGVWNGPLLAQGGFIGVTTIQQAQAGGGSPPLPSFALFGSASPQGTPVSTPTDMFVVQVPEPTTFALVGLGSAALLIFRRRK